MGQFLTNYGMSFLFLGPLLISVAYLTYAERKIIAAMQLRVGPRCVGIWGLLQPIADAVKLLNKVMHIPKWIDPLPFFLAPLITFISAFLIWSVIPLTQSCVYMSCSYGIIVISVLSEIGVYGVMMAGFGTSRYAILGSIRALAQMISYQIPLLGITLCIILMSDSADLRVIVNSQDKCWFFIPLFPLFIIFLISSLAEAHRAPFDLPEAESELVAGYHTEYSGIGFALFFLSEYAHLIGVSSLTTLLFLGGWTAPFALLDFLPSWFWFSIKVSCLLFFFIWIRASFPRIRYDTLMRMCWKLFIPVVFIYFIILSLIIFFMHH